MDSILSMLSVMTSRSSFVNGVEGICIRTTAVSLHVAKVGILSLLFSLVRYVD